MQHGRNHGSKRTPSSHSSSRPRRCWMRATSSTISWPNARASPSAWRSRCKRLCSIRRTTTLTPTPSRPARPSARRSKIYSRSSRSPRISTKRTYSIIISLFFFLINKHNNKNEFPHSSLSLKPYQMIGLNWLRIMHKQCKCITTHRVDVSTTTTTTKCIYRSAWYRRPWSNMRKTYKTMVL